MEDKTIIVKNSNSYNNNNSSSSSSDDDDDDDDEEFRRRRAMRDKKEPEDWDMLVDAFPVLRSFEFRPTSFKNVNVNTHTPLDFARNVELLKYRIRDCIGPDIEKRNPEFNYIVEWFQSLRPVHLCSLWSLASMLATGAVMSQTTFASIWTNDYVRAHSLTHSLKVYNFHIVTHRKLQTAYGPKEKHLVY